MKLFAHGRRGGLAFLQDPLGIRGLAIREGGGLQGGEPTLIQTGVPGRGAHGGRRDGGRWQWSF